MKAKQILYWKEVYKNVVNKKMEKISKKITLFYENNGLILLDLEFWLNFADYRNPLQLTLISGTKWYRKSILVPSHSTAVDHSHICSLVPSKMTRTFHKRLSLLRLYLSFFWILLVHLILLQLLGLVLRILWTEALPKPSKLSVKECVEALMLCSTTFFCWFLEK